MGVSKNRGKTPKSSILIGFYIINHPFWGFLGYHYFWKLPYAENFCELPQAPKTSRETSFYSANDSEKENIPCFVVFGHAITNSNNALVEGKSFKMTIQMRHQGKRKQTNTIQIAFVEKLHHFFNALWWWRSFLWLAQTWRARRLRLESWRSGPPGCSIADRFQIQSFEQQTGHSYANPHFSGKFRSSSSRWVFAECILKLSGFTTCIPLPSQKPTPTRLSSPQDPHPFRFVTWFNKKNFKPRSSLWPVVRGQALSNVCI